MNEKPEHKHEWVLTGTYTHYPQAPACAHYRCRCGKTKSEART